MTGKYNYAKQSSNAFATPPYSIIAPLPPAITKDDSGSIAIVFIRLRNGQIGIEDSTHR
jgi:hypothetical protein